MTRDDIIKLAREAGCLGPDKGGDPYGLWEPHGWENVTELMFRFAALVAAAEREACARVCEDEINRAKPIYSVTAENALRAIRTRGSKPTSVIYSPGQLAERGLTHEDVVKLIKENT